MSVMSLHMPNLQSPIAGHQTLNPIWAKYIREIHSAITAELAPGRVQPFWLSAADLASASNFVQSGATAGLGVGQYLGWAICNGNNDTPTAGTTFLRWSTAGHDASGATGGSDSSAHTHTTDIDHEHAGFTSDSESSHTHVVAVGADGANMAVAQSAGSVTTTYDYVAKTGTVTGAMPAITSAAGSSHTHGINPDQLGEWLATSSAASATDNRPSFKSWVPLMRV